MITRAEIERNAWRTAWQVVQRSGKLHLTESADNTGVTVTHRGIVSLLSNAPLLFIDGVRVGNLTVLKQIPASSIQEIRLLSGSEAAIGTVGDSASGVIEITTITH